MPSSLLRGTVHATVVDTTGCFELKIPIFLSFFFFFVFMFIFFLIFIFLLLFIFFLVFFFFKSGAGWRKKNKKKIGPLGGARRVFFSGV